jgi:hypothetical protein
MRVAISALLLVLVLHFLLESVTFRHTIDLCLQKETFCSKYSNMINEPNKELVNVIECNSSSVDAVNTFPFSENDANFQSNVMNVNRFYKKNIQEEPTDHDIANEHKSNVSANEHKSNVSANEHMSNVSANEHKSNVSANEHKNNFLKDKHEETFCSTKSDFSSYLNQPNEWEYKDELPMNGGSILPGITGYDDMKDNFSLHNFSSLDENMNYNNCSPPERGANVNDDLRMGLGIINLRKRLRT